MKVGIIVCVVVWVSVATCVVVFISIVVSVALTTTMTKTTNTDNYIDKNNFHFPCYVDVHSKT